MASANPHPGNNAAKIPPTHGKQPSTNHAAGAVPSSHGTHRGFVNHWRRSYRGRRAPHPNRTDAQLQAELKHLIKLKADLDVLAQGGQPTQEEKDVLRRDLLAVIEKGANRPAPEPLGELTSSLADVVSRKKRAPLNTEQLAYDLDVVMNSPLATPAEVGRAIGDGQSLLHLAGIGRKDVETLAGRMKAVAMNR